MTKLLFRRISILFRKISINKKNLHHKVMPTWELMPKLNSCIIPWLQQKLFWKGYYFEGKKPLTLSSLNPRHNLLTLSCFNILRYDWKCLHLGAKAVLFEHCTKIKNNNDWPNKEDGAIVNSSIGVTRFFDLDMITN